MQQRQAQPASATTATRANRIRRPADGQGRRLPAGAASECSALAYSKAVAATAGPAPRRYFSRPPTRGEHAQQSDEHGRMTAAGHRWPSRSGVGGWVGTAWELEGVREGGHLQQQQRPLALLPAPRPAAAGLQQPDSLPPRDGVGRAHEHLPRRGQHLHGAHKGQFARRA